MAINKVVYGNNTLLDLTEDTVTEEDVLEGKTFHDKSGQKRTGSATQGGRVQDVEVNGESVVDENGVAEVVVPVSGDVSTTDSFESYTGGKVKSLKVSLTPNQDLHGYDSPWVGGAGKNKCPLTVDGIKSANTAVTWDGNSCVFEGVTITILTDKDNNVIGLKFLGTASRYFYFNVNSNFTIDGTYIISPLPQGAAYSSAFYGRLYYTDGTDIGFLSSEVTVTKQNAVGRMQIVVSTNATVDFTYQPMLRLSTESDPTFESYTNICPISGHTQVDVGDDGKNRYDKSTLTLGKYVNYDGTLTSSGASDATDFIPINGTEDVMLSYSYDSLNSANERYIAFYDAQKNFTDYTVYTPTGADGYKSVKFNSTSNDARYVRFTLDKGAYDVQVELGSTATAYVPYNGYQVTVNLGGTYYSGVLDVVTGVFTPDTAERDLSTLVWNYQSTQTRFIANVADIKRDNTWNNIFLISSCYKVGVPDSSSNYVIGVNDNNIYIKNTDYTDPTALKASLTGQKVVYELATPTPIQLSPTTVKALVGENHLSTPLEGQEIIEIVARNIAEFNEVIDDENISDKFTYSSEKIEDRLDGYVDKDAYFTLPLQTFTFTNKICNVNDSRITSNSLVDVYFTSDSMSSVEDAGITVESQNGKIVMTAEEQPVGTIQGRIKVVN